VSPLLQWELDWIDANSEQYDSTQHANLVKHNIMKRYLTKEIHSRLKASIDELISNLMVTKNEL